MGGKVLWAGPWEIEKNGNWKGSIFRCPAWAQAGDKWEYAKEKTSLEPSKATLLVIQ